MHHGRSGLGRPTVLVGQTTFRWWWVQQISRLSLEILTVQVVSEEAETALGVRLNVRSVAQVKVKAFDEDGAARKINKAKILIAAQHFLGSGDDEATQKGVMLAALKQSLEGHQRQILGYLTVETLYKDKSELVANVRKHVLSDLDEMGFELISFVVAKIEDSSGYMDALGVGQTALAKRQAAEGKSKNESEARKKVAIYNADAAEAEAIEAKKAKVAKNQQLEREAESDRDLQLKQASFSKEINVAKASAAAAKVIEETRQRTQIVAEERRQELEVERVNLEIADQVIKRVKAEKEGESRAALLERTNQAKAIELLAQAEADKIKAIGEANAEIVRLKGEAEARALELKAAALKKYGEAAVAQLIVEQLPAIAAMVAEPLGKTDKMVFVSADGSGPSAFTEDMVRMLAHVPLMVESITGYDLKAAVRAASRKPQLEAEL